VKVGHGVAPIPVPDGSAMGGYADRRGRSSGTADHLEAHVVTFTDGSHRFALVVLDLVCVNVDLADTVRHALVDLGADECWVCATHTHSGPETGCVPQNVETPTPWIEVSTAAARLAARDAIAHERQAEPTAAVVDVTGVASVRSRPGAVRTVPVDVVSFHTTRGQLDGVLVVLPVHPTVLPASSTVVSADLTGAVRRAVAATLGTSWVVVTTGAAGDISTRGVRRGADLDECARLGRVVADHVVAAVRTNPAQGGTVRTAAAELTLLPGTTSTHDDRSTSDSSSRQEETLRQARRVREALGPVTAPLPATVRAARVGSVSLIGLPGEPFLDLRARATEAVGHVLLLGYAGGYIGYLPTREAFGGEPTYETVISVVAAGEPERLVDTGVELLRRLV
jgi:hypothetical protein